MRRLRSFYKVLLNKVPRYICELIPPFTHSFRNPNSFTSFTCRTKYFQNFFFRSSALINFFRPSENKIFNIHDEVGIKLLKRLQLGFSHLPEHKFRHNFVDTLNPLCSCSFEPEATMHIFLCCLFYNVNQANLMSDLLKIDSSLPTENDEKFLDILLHGNSKFNT